MGITIKNPLKEDIIRQYSTMYTLTTYCIPKLEKAMGIRVTDDEITFLTIHFQLAFEKIVNTKHVFLFVQRGRELRNYYFSVFVIVLLAP